MFRNRKKQRIVVGVIAVFLCVGLLGSTIAAYLMRGDQGYAGTGDPVSRLTDEVRFFSGETQKNPDAAANWEGLGNAYYSLGRHYLEKANDPDKGKENLVKAVEAYDKSLAIEPKNPAARVDMAVAAFYSDQLDQAEAQFKQAIAEFPRYPNAHLNYGIFLWQGRKDPKAAVARWNELLKTNPPKEVDEQARMLIQLVEQQTGAAAAAPAPAPTPGSNPPAGGAPVSPSGKVDWNKATEKK